MNKRPDMTMTQWLKRIAFCLCAAALLGCATQTAINPIKGPDSFKLGQKPMMYIHIQQDKRLPAEFAALFQRRSLEAFPGFVIFTDDGTIHDKEIQKADWIMTIRTTRILSRYNFQPFDDNTANAITDCVAGAAFGGLAITPCVVKGDEDFLEATLRDGNSKTLKTYQVAEAAEGITMLPPLTYLRNTDQTERWETMIHDLYEMMGKDGIFQTFPSHPI